MLPVSIHASVKDATFLARDGNRFFSVSIHASVKDATPVRGRRKSRTGFNPRVREGRDIMVVLRLACLAFQSTRP